MFVKDWRVHQEQLKTSSDAMSKGLAETRTQLEKLAEDIAGALEKIASREKYLNTQLESLMTEYRYSISISFFYFDVLARSFNFPKGPLTSENIFMQVVCTNTLMRTNLFSTFVCMRTKCSHAMFSWNQNVRLNDVMHDDQNLLKINCFSGKFTINIVHFEFLNVYYIMYVILNNMQILYKSAS